MIGGQSLTFHLAGINNQNFLMRDDQTGTYWQQVSGHAVFGPMQGAQLELVSTDEVSFALWKSETPDGTVLASVPRDAKEYENDWEEKLKKYPTVVSFSDNKLPVREVVIGISLNREARAFPLTKVLQQAVIQDKVGGVPIVLVAGPDKKSVRAFRSEGVEFFKKPGDAWALIDSISGSEWDFQGCNKEGKCLEPVSGLKDFWFDWRLYNPATTVYSH